MHSRNLLKLSAVCVVVAMLAVSVTVFNVQAGPMQTAEGTTEATAEATMAATEAPTLESTPPVSATLYPPCPPPVGVEYTPEATMAATDAATASATTEATPAATEFVPGYLGVGGESVGNCGTLVVTLSPGAPAELAGIQVGDVIVAVDGMAYRSLETLRAYIISLAAGDRVEVVLKRGDEELTFTITLGQRPRQTPPTAAPEATTEATTEPTAEPTAEATQGS